MPHKLLLLLAASALACSGAPPGAILLQGGTLVGGAPGDVLLIGGRIAAVGEVDAPEAAEIVDVSGRWVGPAGIDSHVHLTYVPEVDAMAAGGIAAAVDLAAPEPSLATPPDALTLLSAGPMVTSIGGYPTNSWGADGYGLECADADAAAAGVDRLLAGGARLIKVPVSSYGSGLDDAQLAAVVGRAHAAGVKVVVHALDDDSALRAAVAGVDALAHTPTAPLSPETIEAWSDRAVIGTLAAFGAGGPALANIAALRDAGATVLYGTDFGNTMTPGIDPTELAAMRDAGFSPEQIQAALTTTPAAYWGLDELGTLAEGQQASVLVLPDDPLVDPTAWSRAEMVWIGGERRR
ncbi:MAG: imidazolonepropionase-like amidohydrolase [Myxococcota bacterium]|jgi:imidazolonepropionase-like amidohydrolase